MIIAHLTYDIPTLKACVFTNPTWYSIVTPHLHHTVSLGERFSAAPDVNNNTRLSRLPSWHKFGLLPLVKQLHFTQAINWTGPATFDSQNMRYFRAMVNLQELRISHLDLAKFPMGFGGCLGHFSPTLRSLALHSPRGFRRQLIDLFRLFPMLDDIEISLRRREWGDDTAIDNKLVPVSGWLGGRLALSAFDDVELLKDMVVAFGGMRFTSMDLPSVRGAETVLEACAHTLETLRIHPGQCDPFGCKVPLPESIFFRLELMPFCKSTLQSWTYLATPPFDPWRFNYPPTPRWISPLRSRNLFPPSSLQRSPKLSSYSGMVYVALRIRGAWLQYCAGSTG